MKILVTGGTGMIGSRYKSIKSNHEITLVGTNNYDLTSKKSAKKMLYDHRPDAIIHLAARVGGVKSNTNFVADFFYENTLINTNVLKAAKDQKIPKLVSLLSTCVYPDNACYPLSEDQLHLGEPHHSNFGYAYSKRMLEVYSRSIRKQYGLEYITAIPNNIYGPNDNFDLENGHVIPAIIRKVHHAKISGEPPVMWGSGGCLREFTYSNDIARSLLNLVENYSEDKPINIGKTGEYSINQVVEKVCKIFEYSGDIIWDKDKPEGQLRKPSCNKRFLRLYPKFKYTDIKLGLQETIEWYNETHPKVRGVK
jgi:GDP-L-fucose synthase